MIAVGFGFGWFYVEQRWNNRGEDFNQDFLKVIDSTVLEDLKNAPEQIRTNFYFYSDNLENNSVLNQNNNNSELLKIIRTNTIWTFSDKTVLTKIPSDIYPKYPASLNLKPSFETEFDDNLNGEYFLFHPDRGG